MYELTMFGNQFFGQPNEVRQNQIRQVLEKNLSQQVEYREEPIVAGLVRPAVTVRYQDGSQHQEMIHALDALLQQLGGYATQAVVAEVVSRAVEGMVTGAGAGGIAGSAARQNGQKLLGLVLGGLIGGMIGSMLEKDRRILLVGSKIGNQWTFQPADGQPA